MLSAEYRLRRSEDFSRTVRRGRRASRRLLTVHLLVPPAPQAAPDKHPEPPPRAGLVVSKAVGGSVVRHRTARRLRHLLRSRMADLPPGALLVVRAAPPAGDAESSALGADLDGALATALRRRA